MEIKFLLLIAALASASVAKNPTTLAPCSLETESGITCGTFIQYFDHDEVIQHGFSAGRYMDDTEAYVGMGFDPRCEDSYNNPARLKATGVNPGAYMSCEYETHDIRVMRYLKKHPALKWIRVIGSLKTKRNLVTVESGRYTFHFGRKRLTDTNGEPYYVVSKVFTSGDMLYSQGSAHHSAKGSEIEILAC